MDEYRGSMRTGGVAFFPTKYQQLNNVCTQISFTHDEWVSKVHLCSAGLFFIILGGVAIFQFSKIKAPLTPRKKEKRKAFYITCGIVMWTCITSLIPMTIFDQYREFLATNKIVFFVEIIALIAFVSCWIIKGYERQLETLEIKVV